MWTEQEETAEGRCQAELQGHFLLGEAGRAEGAPGPALNICGRCRGGLGQVDRRAPGKEQAAGVWEP